MHLQVLHVLLKLVVLLEAQVCKWTFAFHSPSKMVFLGTTLLSSIRNCALYLDMILPPQKILDSKGTQSKLGSYRTSCKKNKDTKNYCTY